MSVFEESFPKTLYHSYVIEGEPETTAKDLLLFLSDRKEIVNNNPDVLFQVYESFTIDNSAEIKDWHSKKGITNGKRICIIATKFINREAEQTLLKIIEEPSLNTHFFIIVPDSSVILPTIISRVHVIKVENDSSKEIQKEAQSFIKLSPKERVDAVTVIIKNNKEENSGQVRYYATTFVNELESIFYQKFKKDKDDKNTRFILDELQKARGYLSTPGASVKMILEHLALMI